MGIRVRNRRSVGQQFGGFLIVGAANTVLTLLIYELLIFWIPYGIAYTLAFAAGLVFALTANARFAFATRVTAPRAVRFTLFYLISYALGFGLVAFLIELVHVPAALAPAAALVITVPLNFFGSRVTLGRS
jgi:putative flippase GtrA